MTTYNTNEPLGSASAKVLYDNAQNFDHLSNDRVNETWDDRFGVPRLTWHGMEQRYKTALVNLGLNPVGTFQGGAVINSAGDIIQDETTGAWYRWDDLTTLPKTVPSGSTPDSSGGTGVGKWLAVDVSDVLRKDLAKQTGAGLVGTSSVVGEAVTLETYVAKINKAVYLTELAPLITGTDWTAAFQFVNDNSSITCFIIPAGTVELRPAPYTIVISQDATINITTVNIQQGGIHPKTGTKFLGKLTINLGDTNAYAWQRAHVRIGEYDSGAGDRDIFIEDVTLLGGHINCNGVFITGDSFNIEFGNIKIPDNAKIGRGFLAHWGGKRPDIRRGYQCRHMGRRYVHQTPAQYHC
ncbi:TPA: hypothetical protein LSH87_002028 [Citrobacter koseri]|uniref:tail fiber/spike domain-containing protein n=1 Tax=Citrobacter koseri TaxID=545 RepID=UPI0023AF8F8E|nr:hypothetical protein [Citrobacter koseri]HBL6929066.1 hypothetical protein [Citrobacter koseri]